MTKKTKKSGVTTPTAEVLIPQPHHNYYAVMEFRTEQQLHLSDNSRSFVNTYNHYYRNGVEAMEKLLHANNPHTIIATGETIVDLRQNMIKQTKLFNITNK